MDLAQIIRKSIGECADSEKKKRPNILHIVIVTCLGYTTDHVGMLCCVMLVQHLVFLYSWGKEEVASKYPSLVYLWSVLKS